MTARELIAIELFCVSLPALVIALAAFVVAIVPRTYTKRIRHRLAGMVLWQWVKGSKVSAWLHTWLWRNGNGNGKKPEDLEKYL